MGGNISQLMELGSLDPSNQLNLDHGQKPRLPLWLHHDNANYGNPNDFLSTPSTTTSTLAHELVQMAPHTSMLDLSSSQKKNNKNNNQWFVNDNGGGAITTTSSSMPRVLKEEEENKTLSPM